MPQPVITYHPQACPRCQQLFECKAAEIGICQCSGIHLGKELSQFINQQYHSCLCINCLQALKQTDEEESEIQKTGE